MKTVIALFFVLMLSGCVSWFKSDTPKVEPATVEETTRAAFLDRVMAAAAAPLFELTCPAEGCTIGSLKVGNPFAVSQLADTAKVIFAPKRNEWLEFWGSLINGAMKVGGYAVIGDAAARITGSIVNGYTTGFGSMAQIAGFGFDATGKVASMIPQPGAVTNTTTNTTNTLSGTGVMGGGQYIGPVQNNNRVCGFVGTPPTFTCFGG